MRERAPVAPESPERNFTDMESQSHSHCRPRQAHGSKPEKQAMIERERTAVRPIDYIPPPYQPVFNFPYFNEMQQALLHQVFETDVSPLDLQILISTPAVECHHSCSHWCREDSHL
jgi:hypothetical protein